MSPTPALLCVLMVLATATGASQGDAAQSQPWGYRLGESRPPQQANFCDTVEAALEIADIFERFGARTGFAALSNAPNCALRVHAVTPRALLRRVRVDLASGDSYAVNFIQVDAADGSTPVLVTTRTLAE